MPHLIPLWALGSLIIGCKQDFGVKEVLAELSVTPGLSDLGVVAIGDSVPFQLLLTNLDGPDVGVTAVDVANVDGSYFSFTGALPEVPREGTAVLDLSYDPLDAGFHYARVTVKSDAKEPEIVVEVRAKAATPGAEIWPGVLDFGPVAVGTTDTHLVFVVNTGEMDLDIVGAEASDPAFGLADALPLVVPENGSLPLSIQYTAATLDPISASLEVTVEQPGVDLGTVWLWANDCTNGNPADFDQDGDGWLSCVDDCDDADPEVHPGAREYFDGVDQDCDGIVDEGTEGYDDDGDGYTELEGDCDDTTVAVNPMAVEDYTNGVDDDCDGTVDAGTYDVDGDGYSPDGGDCEDTDPVIHPGAPESVDGLDNDCDGLVDEGTDAYDDDGDGLSEAAGDCDDTDAAIYPSAPEAEDWHDNDCDGYVDEGTDHADDDGDGYTEDGGDCNDANSSVSPAAMEVSGDHVDQNCDGVAE